MRLDNKTFIITGASSGIGRGLALEMFRENANLVCMARRSSLLKELQNETDKKRVQVFTGDVTKAKDCKDVIALALKQFKNIDGIIHNAGVSMRATAEEADLKVQKNLMDVNFFSLTYLYKYGLPALKETKGHLVCVSSLMGLFSTQLRSGYAASKHAVQGFMDSVRLETIDYGLHVMTISPGFIQTDIALSSLSADGGLHGVKGSHHKGIPVEYAAKRIIDGIVDRKRDLVIAKPRERLALFLSKWAPGFLDKIIARADVN